MTLVVTVRALRSALARAATVRAGRVSSTHVVTATRVVAATSVIRVTLTAVCGTLLAALLRLLTLGATVLTTRLTANATRARRTTRGSTDRPLLASLALALRVGALRFAGGRGLERVVADAGAAGARCNAGRNLTDHGNNGLA